MRTKPWRSPRSTRAAVGDQPYDDLLLDAPTQLGMQRADCCVASAAYRVVLPPAEARPRPAELLLCGHHYRQSRAAFGPAGAVVFDAHNRLVGHNLLAGRKADHACEPNTDSLDRDAGGSP